MKSINPGRKLRNKE